MKKHQWAAGLSKSATENNKSSSARHHPKWNPHWPKTWKPLWFLVAIMGAFGAVLALWPAVLGWRTGDWGLVIGGVSCALGMLLMSPVFMSLAGITSSGVSRSVRSGRDDDLGPGLVLTSTGNRLMMGVMGAFGVWAFTAAAVQFSGMSESLFPDSRATDAHAVYALCGGSFLSAMIVVMLLSKRHELYLACGGVARRTHIRRWWRGRCLETFVSWDDIDELRVQIFAVKAARYEVIDIVSRKFEPERALQQFDKTDSIAVRAFEMGADPNALMALMRWCWENPWARERLTHQDARNLLQAPPLRERLRLSHAALAEQKTQEVESQT